MFPGERRQLVRNGILVEEGRHADAKAGAVVPQAEDKITAPVVNIDRGGSALDGPLDHLGRDAHTPILHRLRAELFLEKLQGAPRINAYAGGFQDT